MSKKSHSYILCDSEHWALTTEWHEKRRRERRRKEEKALKAKQGLREGVGGGVIVSTERE
jgi:hypothetical protein